jgi:hypothetical protein
MLSELDPWPEASAGDAFSRIEAEDRLGTELLSGVEERETVVVLILDATGKFTAVAVVPLMKLIIESR